MSKGALIVQVSGQLSRSRAAGALNLPDKSTDGKSENISSQEKLPDQGSQTDSKARQNEPQTAQTGQPERKTFWERVFRMPPLRKRVEKVLVEEWKFSEVKQRDI